MSYQDAIVRDAKLIILRELDLQVDGQLNETSLRRVLDVYGIKRTNDWVLTQLNGLAELGAIVLKPYGIVTVAAITSVGRDHVHERAVLAGVTRPYEFGK